MPLTVGSLTVREPRKDEKTPAGVRRPRVFRAFLRDFEDFEIQRKRGRLLSRDMTNGLVVVQGMPFVHHRGRADQIYADEYCAACRKLDQTVAGERARKLLLRYLSPEQQTTALECGYFELAIHNRALVDRCLERGRPVFFSTLFFRIYRGWPNGNIQLGYEPGRYEYNLCLHPPTPHPIDDICLAQKMMLEHSPEEFIREANITENKPGPVTPFHFGSMFHPLPERPPLVIPHRREQTAR